jgi:hypothetical protein
MRLMADQVRDRVLGDPMLAWFHTSIERSLQRLHSQGEYSTAAAILAFSNLVRATQVKLRIPRDPGKSKAVVTAFVQEFEDTIRGSSQSKSALCPEDGKEPELDHEPDMTDVDQSAYWLCACQNLDPRYEHPVPEFPIVPTGLSWIEELETSFHPNGVLNRRELELLAQNDVPTFVDYCMGHSQEILEERRIHQNQYAGHPRDHTNPNLVEEMWTAWVGRGPKSPS